MMSLHALRGLSRLRPAVIPASSMRASSSYTNCHSSSKSETPRLSFVNSTSVRVSDINSRLETLSLTASFMAGVPLSQLEVELPSISKKEIVDPNAQKIPAKTDPVEGQKIKEIVDPLKKTEIRDPTSRTVKYAHRMLRIRKRKIKVHHRKKRQRDRAATYRRRRYNRKRNWEIGIRSEMGTKIQAAKRFNAEEYIESYLEDMRKPLIPLTYKGRRKYVWEVKTLMQKDELNKIVKENEELDIITKEPLVLPGETVEQYVKRIDSKFYN